MHTANVLVMLRRATLTPKVVIATRLFPPEPAAAAFRQGALARALRARGAQVEVLTTRPPREVRGEPDVGDVTVRRWPVLRDSGGNVRGYVQYASFDVPLALRLAFTRRPDLVVVEPPPTTGVAVRMVARLRRVPYVYYAADVVSDAAAGIGVNTAVVRVLRAVERWVLSGARLVLVVSPEVRQRVLEMNIGHERVIDVGTGVDTGVFSPNGPADDQAVPTFVYAGTMSEIQGASVFIEALGRLRTAGSYARLVVFGQGVEEARLRRLADHVAPGGVDFLGVRPGEEVARALRSACAGLAAVRPNRGYDYAYSTKALATLACGTPVVYAGVGPCGDLVREHALGWAVPWDVKEVAAAMAEAVEGSSWMSRPASAASWATMHHSLAGVADRAAAHVLRTALGRRRDFGDVGGGLLLRSTDVRAP